MGWLSTAVLWAHVVCASWWILACVTMAVAGLVVGAESMEGREFVARVVPKLNQANAVAAATLLLTGVANIFVAGEHRGFAFPSSFKRVLAAKVVLYLLMVAALCASLKAGRKPLDRAGRQAPASTGRLAVLSALSASMGAAAMILGVWLAGD